MFSILAEAQALEAVGRRIVHLEIGDTRGFRNEELAGILERAVPAAQHGYTASAGAPSLRRAVADSYSAEKGVDVGPERVVIAPANALISQALTIMTDRGDHVLLPDPGFPTYWLAADFLELEARAYPLHEEDGWNPRTEEVEAMLDDPRVRAIVVNSPSNPLGIALDADRMDAIVDAAVARGVAVLYDETYKNLDYTGNRRQAHRDEVSYLYSFSKDAAVPGFRTGYVVAPEPVATKLGELGSLIFSCQPPLFQDVLAEYLQSGVRFDARLREEMPRRIELLDELLDGVESVTYVRPSAAFYAFANIGGTGMDPDTFARRLLHEHGVCVCPGTAFGPGGAQHVRLTLSGAEPDLREGLGTFAAFCRDAVQAAA